MNTMNDLALHYVGIAEQIGLDGVHVDDGFVRVQADGQQMAIDLYPSDPGYLRVLTGSQLPYPADPWLVADEVTEQIKMVKAQVHDDGIRVAVETLADPDAREELPRADLAAEALSRAVGALLVAVGHISDAAELAGILAVSGDAPQPVTSWTDEPGDIYVPCPDRGRHTALTECWMCWADVHSGRIPAGSALRRTTPAPAPDPA